MHRNQAGFLRFMLWLSFFVVFLHLAVQWQYVSILDDEALNSTSLAYFNTHAFDIVANIDFLLMSLTPLVFVFWLITFVKTHKDVMSVRPLMVWVLALTPLVNIVGLFFLMNGVLRASCESNRVLPMVLLWLWWLLYWFAWLLIIFTIFLVDNNDVDSVANHCFLLRCGGLCMYFVLGQFCLRWGLFIMSMIQLNEIRLSHELIADYPGAFRVS